jgi:opacity protein-like surface antigen
MQKKIVLALLMAALLVGGAFAEGFSMSAGGGLLFDLSGNNGVKAGDYYAGTRNLSFGGYGFFDATYAEVDVSFAYGMLTAVMDGGGASGSEDAGSVLQLGFSLLGKYPIDLGSFTLFPLLGINYNMVLSASDPDGNSIDNAGDSSQLGFLAGVGADFGLTDSLYLRAEGLFQLRLPSKVQSDMADFSNDASTTFGMGPRIKVGVGYKF